MKLMYFSITIFPIKKRRSIMAELFKGSDETHWSKSYSDSTGQVNDLSGKVGSGDHCHMWKDSDGDSGVEHETTHGGQFESGDIAFDTKTGMPYGADVFDEQAAYKAQYAYDPSSVSGLTS